MNAGVSVYRHVQASSLEANSAFFEPQAFASPRRNRHTALRGRRQTRERIHKCWVRNPAVFLVQSGHSSCFRKPGRTQINSKLVSFPPKSVLASCKAVSPQLSQVSTVACPIRGESGGHQPFRFDHASSCPSQGGFVRLRRASGDLLRSCARRSFASSIALASPRLDGGGPKTRAAQSHPCPTPG